jgi:hypothetical protein
MIGYGGAFGLIFGGRRPVAKPHSPIGVLVYPESQSQN